MSTVLLVLGIVGVVTAVITGGAALLLVALSVIAPTSVAFAQTLGVTAIVSFTVGVSSIALGSAT